MLLADCTHLSGRLNEQIAWIADLIRRKDKFPNFELLNEFPFENSRALLLVECNKNPVLFTDRP